MAAGEGALEFAMLMNLGLGWMIIAGGTVFGVAYMMSLMMESSIGREGYGPFAHAVFIFLGFFGAIFIANQYGIRLHELKWALAYGGGGAAVALMSMLVGKAVFMRMGA
jgi:hypothetical protein